MARKAWDQLSPGYRARLERAGITPQAHGQGVKLTKARGHNEREVLNHWVEEFANVYRQDEGDIREALSDYGFPRVYKAIRLQEKMQAAYHNGDMNKAAQLWRTRDQGLPEWMHFYHGYFS